MKKIDVLKKLSDNMELMLEMERHFDITKGIDSGPTSFYFELKDDYEELRRENGRLVSAYKDLKEK